MSCCSSVTVLKYEPKPSPCNPHPNPVQGTCWGGGVVAADAGVDGVHNRTSVSVRSAGQRHTEQQRITQIFKFFEILKYFGIEPRNYQYVKIGDFYVY